jgi:hypothetical protein
MEWSHQVWAVRKFIGKTACLLLPGEKPEAGRICHQSACLNDSITLKNAGQHGLFKVKMDLSFSLLPPLPQALPNHPVWLLQDRVSSELELMFGREHCEVKASAGAENPRNKHFFENDPMVGPLEL